ncbi:hypothetical protein bcgnr5372_46130 [Bacillus luti]|nr:hypothetical protein [Bacillus cereus]HDR8331743.1 hypothetical protein [Bacillus cereus]HDR8338121.1 hypothetical protein [Bacillus cereus]
MTKEDNEMSAIMKELMYKLQNSNHTDKEVSIEKSIVVDLVKYFKEKEEAEEAEEAEEEKEDAELSARYGSRADLPEDQWITLPPNQSLKDWYYERKREHLNGK